MTQPKQCDDLVLEIVEKCDDDDDDGNDIGNEGGKSEKNFLSHASIKETCMHTQSICVEN